jgi:hypothetical protein
MRLRPLLTALSCTAVLASPCGAALPRFDAVEELRRLASTRAGERESAQRWLAVHLAPEDQRVVADTARDGDAETRRRLVRALSGDDRHLELIVRLCDDTGEPARLLGRQALTELVLAWLPGLGDKPLSAEDLIAERAERAAEIFALDARVETLEERFERLARHTDLGVPLVITPELLAEDVPSLRPALTGTALELLSATVQSEGLSLAGVGRGSEIEGPAVLVVDQRGRARMESGFQRLEEWCLDVRRGGPKSRAASLALASSGWPAALAWLESRALHSPPSTGRDAALEGLLAAARQGHVAPGLTRSEVRRSLLQLGDAWLAAGEAGAKRRGEGLARALAELGPRTPAGDDCGALLLEKWPQDAPDEVHWLRLVALEGQRSADSKLAARAAGIAVDERRSPSLRIQALRALAASGGTGVELRDATGLQRLRTHAVARDGESELLDLLGAVAEPPAADLRTDALRSADPRSAPFVARWSLRCGDRAAAAELLTAAAADGLPDADDFERWLQVVRDAGRVAGVDAARDLIEASVGTTNPELARQLTLHARIATTEEQRAWSAELAERDVLEGRSLVGLGALAAGPLGTSVRERLIAELERDPVRSPRDLRSACDAAASALRAARRDRELSQLKREIWKAVRPASHPLHDALGPDRYPARVELTPQRLGAFVRRLGE